MKKRHFAVLLAVSLAASLSACGGGGSDGDSTTAATTAAGGGGSSESGGTASTQAAVDPEHPGWLTPEKKTLTVMCGEGANASYPKPSNDLPFWQFLEDYTNVHIEWNVQPSVGYGDQVSTMLGAGVDLPDIMVTGSFTKAYEAGRNGILANLEPYWDTCFTNTQAYYDQEGLAYKDLITAGDGGIYALCGSENPIEGHAMFMYNTEWMKKLNLEVPKTLDEFTNVLYTMQAAGDLNGNGEADEIVLTSSGLTMITGIIGNAFGLEQYQGNDAMVLDPETGKATDEYESDAEREMWRYVHQLYADGILDPEIFNMGADLLSQKVAADRVGVMCYYSAFAITYGSLTPAGVQDPMGEHYTLGYPISSEHNGNVGYYMRRETVSGSPTSISADASDVELACRWLDTMYADPVVLQTRTWGIEGEDWEYDANGEPQLIYSNDGKWDIASKGCGQIPLCHIQTSDQLLNSKRQYQWYIDQYDAIREATVWKSPSIHRVTTYTDEEQAIITQYKENLSTYISEMRDKFIRGEASLDDDWDEYVQTLKELGMDQWVSVWQSVYERFQGDGQA